MIKILDCDTYGAPEALGDGNLRYFTSRSLWDRSMSLEKAPDPKNEICGMAKPIKYKWFNARKDLPSKPGTPQNRAECTGPWLPSQHLTPTHTKAPLARYVYDTTIHSKIV